MEEITIVDFPSQTVLGTKQTGKYELIPSLIRKVFEYAIPHGAQIQGPPMFICHETSVEAAEEANREGTAKVEIVVPIAAKIDGTDNITCYELPGGCMAKIVHKGPYETCESTYQKLFCWLSENNKRINGPIREVYCNDPREVPQEEILTEIYAPIE